MTIIKTYTLRNTWHGFEIIHITFCGCDSDIHTRTSANNRFSFVEKISQTATGETFESRKGVIDALVAEQDRLLAVEQQNKLAAVDGQALTGFSKEAFMERLKLKELET